MSPTEVREAIATAASTAPGVTVTPYYRQITKAGEGMVRYDHTDYPNKFGGLVTWQVVVMLPQDQRAAEQWLDQNGTALRVAVEPQLSIRSLTAIQLNTPDAGSWPAVVIEGTREED